MNRYGSTAKKQSFWAQDMQLSPEMLYPSRAKETVLTVNIIIRGEI